MLASFDAHIFWEALTSKPYWNGALLALELTLVSLAAACVIGFFLALGRSSRFRWVRAFVFFYNWFFRATPTLLQLLFVWNALAAAVAGVRRELVQAVPRRLHRALA